MRDALSVNRFGSNVTQLNDPLREGEGVRQVNPTQGSSSPRTTSLRLSETQIEFLHAFRMRGGSQGRSIAAGAITQTPVGAEDTIRRTSEAKIPLGFPKIVRK